MHNKRFDMIDDLEAYISMANNTSDMVAVDSIVESTIQKRMEEYMFLGLRLLEGIDEADFLYTFNCSLTSVYDDNLDYLIKESLIERADAHIRLTPRGIDISNYVLSYFLLTT
jgi:oxygen-independent coproporphyrinogen-3 oxidase